MISVEPVACPFKILVDTAEGQPFTFDNINSDSKDDFRPIAITTEFRCLGRFPNGRGDYSIDGMSFQIGIERKSVEDLWGTLLGWETDYQRERGGTGRRDRFKKELENLEKLESALVVVEASLASCLEQVPEWGERPAEHNRKTLNRTIISMMQSYRVPWLFCDSRRLAEVETFRWLDRYYRKHI